MLNKNFLASSIFLLALPGLSYAQTGPGAEFKSKLLAEWNSTMDSVKSAQWLEKMEFRSLTEPKHVREKDVIRVIIKRDSGSLFSTQVVHFDENKNVVRADTRSLISNNIYRAELRMPKGGSEWLLSKFDQENPGTQDAGRLQQMRCPWTCLGDVYLGQWLSDSSFQFTRVEAFANQSGLVRGHFECDPSRRQSPEIPGHVQSGFIDFDTANSYRPTGFEFHHFKSKEIIEGMQHGKLEYAAGGRIPVVESIIGEEVIRSQRKGLIAAGIVFVFSDVKYNVDLNDTEFRLSHFGLPEPIGVEGKKPVPNYVWLLSAAAVFAALAIGFRYLAARYRTAPK